MTPAWPHGDPRDLIRSIVADPRYTADPPAPSVGRSWLDDAGAWIAGVLRGIFHALDHLLGARNPLDAAIGFALIAAAFALLGLCVYLLVRSAGRARPARRGRSRPESVSASERDAATLRTAALAAARGGRYRDAAALLFASAIRALHEADRVSDDVARTPGEYQRLVHDPLFDALTADAVIAVFAAAEPHGDLFERMHRTYDRFFDAPTR